MCELHEKNPVVAELIEALGGTSEAAELFGVKQPSVSEWLSRGQLPIGRVAQAEAITANKFTRYRLRPDIFGADPAADSAKAA